MTLEQELKLYEKALKHYTKALKNKWRTRYFTNIIGSTSKGFCFYFEHKHNTRLKELSVLYSLGKPFSNKSYWFDKNNLKGRISLLKKAIYVIKLRNAI